MHDAFGPKRVNDRREFFKIEPAQAIAVLSLHHQDGRATTCEAIAELEAGMGKRSATVEALMADLNADDLDDLDDLDDRSNRPSRRPGQG